MSTKMMEKMIVKHALQNSAADTGERAMGTDAAGFITNQKSFSDLKYGLRGSRKMGCGWIACYNVLHALGLTAVPHEIITALESRGFFSGKLSTSMPAVAAYLRGRGLRCRVSVARRTPPRAAADALVVLYEGLGKKGALVYPYGHFITFVPERENGAVLRDERGWQLWRVYNGARRLDSGRYVSGDGVASYEEYFAKDILPTFVCAVNKI